MDFAKLEDAVRINWSKNKLKDKLKMSRYTLGKGKFKFLDGCPFINSSPHHGHLLVSGVKDTIARFKSQQGYQMTYQIGFDTHGLPIESVAEKTVGKISPNDTVEKIKVFNDECRKIISSCSEEWFSTLGQFGRQFERDQTYYTCSLEYMDNIWGAMKILFDKELIYLSRKVMSYSPACETPLSNFEASSNYKDRTDTTVYARFKLTNSDEYLVIWTTTPWSLVANQGICVNPALEYSLVEYENTKYWMTSISISRVFSADNYTVVKTALGSSLVGLEYEPIFNYSSVPYKVYGDSYVKDTTGTGLVHLAPLFGEDDFRVMKLTPEQLPEYLVDSRVRFTIDLEINGKNIKDTFVMDTALDITIALKKSGIVLKSEKITHSCQYCWRTDTPLVFLACDAWFINVQKLIPDILENNSKINWYPKYVGTERFANWIKSAPDWCISRNRVWGTPINIWLAPSGKTKCIGSVNELEELTGQKFTDLHLDFVNELTFDFEGETYSRTFGVLDCWFDSGIAPIARTKDAFKPRDSDSFFSEDVETDVDFIAESLDQTRGWFYTLNVLSTALYNKPAFKNVIVSGLILADDGRKMSKRLKNYTDPLDIMNKYGSDVLRLYLLGSPATKAEPFCFKDDDLSDITRKLITYGNAISMFKDSYHLFVNVNKNELVSGFSSTNKLDVWLYNIFHSFRNAVYDNLNALELTQIPNLIYKFIDKLCNTYIKLSRDRLKSQSTSGDARESLTTLEYVLNSTNLLLAPFMPHLSEHYHYLMKPDDISIHLHYIHLDKRVVPSQKIINSIYSLNELFETVRNLRSRMDFPIGYSLNELLIYQNGSCGILEFEDVIKKELNIKSITMMPLDELTKKYIPNKGALGKAYKGLASKYVSRIEEGDIEGLDISLYNIEYVIKNKEGYISSKFDYYLETEDIQACKTAEDIQACKTAEDTTFVIKRFESIIYLSNSVTEQNKMEAEVNHFRRQVNLLRKEMGFKMYDTIYIETMCRAFWSKIDPLLINSLKAQLGGKFNVVDDIPMPVKIIKSLNGEYDISLSINHS